MTTKPDWERLAIDLDGIFISEEIHATKAKRIATELRRLGHENTKQAEQIKAITHLVHQLHQAKGRYHTQLATCALFDAFGLSNTKPERKTK